MSLDEFNELIDKSEPVDKIVFIQLKYSWEEKPRYINELYIYEPADGLPYSKYVWLNDWFEGEEEVKILGCINVSDVDVPLFI